MSRRRSAHTDHFTFLRGQAFISHSATTKYCRICGRSKLKSRNAFPGTAGALSASGSAASLLCIASHNVRGSTPQRTKDGSAKPARLVAARFETRKHYLTSAAQQHSLCSSQDGDSAETHVAAVDAAALRSALSPTKGGGATGASSAANPANATGALSLPAARRYSCARQAAATGRQDPQHAIVMERSDWPCCKLRTYTSLCYRLEAANGLVVSCMYAQRRAPSA